MTAPREELPRAPVAIISGMKKYFINDWQLARECIDRLVQLPVTEISSPKSQQRTDSVLEQYESLSCKASVSRVKASLREHGKGDLANWLNRSTTTRHFLAHPHPDKQAQIMQFVYDHKLLYEDLAGVWEPMDEAIRTPEVKDLPSLPSPCCAAPLQSTIRRNMEQAEARSNKVAARFIVDGVTTRASRTAVQRWETIEEVKLQFFRKSFQALKESLDRTEAALDAVVSVGSPTALRQQDCCLSSESSARHVRFEDERKANRINGRSRSRSTSSSRRTILRCSAPPYVIKEF